MRLGPPASMPVCPAFAVLLVCVIVLPTLAEEPKVPKTLDGLQFQSVKKFEIGALPTGPVMGFRSLNFKDGKFTYAPSDAIETGDYKWDATTGFVTGTGLSDKKFKGQYDAKSKTLTWDGAKYKVPEPSKPKDKS
jgi:hypothetical protein